MANLPSTLLCDKPLPSIFQSGPTAKLFPSFKMQNRERRLVSIFLAILPRAPALAERLLKTTGFVVRKTTKISVFTEVKPSAVLTNESNNIFDGLIVAHTGNSEWKALLEAKVGGNDLTPKQIADYLDFAKNNPKSGIRTIITVSNKFVACHDHPAVKISGNLLRKTNLFHWSWTYIATQCKILLNQKNNLDDRQRFLLSDFLTLLEDKDSSVECFTKMPQCWTDLVVTIAEKNSMKKSSSMVRAVSESWIEKTSAITLMITECLGKEVKSNFSSGRNGDYNELVEGVSRSIVNENSLKTELNIPGAPSKVIVDVDLLAKSILVSMRIEAPVDRNSTYAKVRWLTKVIKKDDPRARVAAIWPGGAKETKAPLTDLRNKPLPASFALKGKILKAFRVEFFANDGNRFSGPETFVKDLDDTVAKFYNIVVQNLL